MSNMETLNNSDARQRLRTAQTTSNTAKRKRADGAAYVRTLGIEQTIGFNTSSSAICMWPLDSGGCCGAPVADRRKSYCDEHAAVAYVKPSTNDRIGHD